jgi:hypothetical protein
VVCPRAKSTAYGLKVFLILQKPMAERKSPCRRLSSFCGNFDELIVKIDGFAKKVDKFLMM